MKNSKVLVLAATLFPTCNKSYSTLEYENRNETSYYYETEDESLYSNLLLDNYRLSNNCEEGED